MKIETISYKRTLNLGDYNSCTLEVTANAEDSVSAQKVHDDLVQFVEENIRRDRGEFLVDSELPFT